MVSPRTNAVQGPPPGQLVIKGEAKRQRLFKTLHHAYPKAIGGLRRFAKDFTGSLKPSFVEDPIVSADGLLGFEIFQREIKLFGQALIESEKADAPGWDSDHSRAVWIFRRFNTELQQIRDAIDGPPSRQAFDDLLASSQGLEYPVKKLAEYYQAIGRRR